MSERGPKGPLLAAVPTRGGTGGMLPQEILGVIRCFQKHFVDNFQMSYFCVNTCSGRKFIVDVKYARKVGGGQLAICPLFLPLCTV